MCILCLSVSTAYIIPGIHLGHFMHIQTHTHKLYAVNIVVLNNAADAYGTCKHISLCSDDGLAWAFICYYDYLCDLMKRYSHFISPGVPQRIICICILLS